MGTLIITKWRSWAKDSFPGNAAWKSSLEVHFMESHSPENECKHSSSVLGKSWDTVFKYHSPWHRQAEFLYYWAYESPASSPSSCFAKRRFRKSLGSHKTDTAARNLCLLPPALSNHRALPSSEVLMSLPGELDRHGNAMGKLWRVRVTFF